LSQGQEGAKVEEVEEEAEGDGDAEVDDNADAQSEAEDEDTKDAEEAAHKSSQYLAIENEPPRRYPHRSSSLYDEATEIHDAFMEKKRNI
jgi:hypothetical protein